MKSKKILFIATSHDKMGDTSADTGIWMEGLATPYYIFKDAGASITLASPAGDDVPVDSKSRSILMVTRSVKRFYKDEEAVGFLASSVPLEQIEADDFDMVFIPAGHGAAWDLADNPVLKKLLETFYRQNKLIAAVSHGVAGLLSLQNEDDEFLIKNKQLTGISNTEEESMGSAAIVPFSVEDSLVAKGALYSKNEKYLSHVVSDGNIITGQNPASSQDVADKIVGMMKLSKYNTPLPAVAE